MLSLFMLVLLLILLLHWPYRWNRVWDFLGRESGELRSAMYTYAYGPIHDRFDYDGLCRLQTWLLLIITTAIGRLQPDLVIWLVEVIRQVLGL